jgi:hypothetical protein
MSLRRDIHVAFESIAPPLGGMPERVVRTVLAEQAARRRKGRMVLRFRQPLSLVAAVLLIAVVAALLVGGRVLQDWNAFHSVPSRGDSSQLAQLEARPLNLPVLYSISECHLGPLTSDNSALGSGPLYAYGSSKFTRTAWGTYNSNVLYTDRQITGPILVRARDLLNNSRIVFVGTWAGGPKVGTDVLHGSRVDQRSELVLNEKDTRPVVDNPPAQPHAFVWQFTAGVPDGSSAIGWQIDGDGFSEVFVLC